MEKTYILEYEYNDGTTTRGAWLVLAYDELSALHYAVERFIIDPPANAGDVVGAYIYEYNDAGTITAVFDITETFELITTWGAKKK